MEKKKKTHSRISTWFRRMFFGPGRELSFLEEEQVQSPLRSMAKRFFTNKIAMTGLIVFLSCLLLVIIGPIFLPLDLSFRRDPAECSADEKTGSGTGSFKE